jgi:hypothetical protein
VKSLAAELVRRHASAIERLADSGWRPANWTAGKSSAFSQRAAYSADVVSHRRGPELGFERRGNRIIATVTPDLFRA